MGIDYGLYNSETDETEIEEHFATVGGFYNVAQVLSFLVPYLDPKNVPDEEFKEAFAPVWEWFQGYIGEDLETAMSYFQSYCVFTTGMAKQMYEDPERKPEDPHALDHLIADPDDFAPETQALLGRLFLSGDPLLPDDAYPLTSMGSALLGLMDLMVEQAEAENDTDTIAVFNAADDCLRPFVEYCREKAELGRAVGFTF